MTTGHEHNYQRTKPIRTSSVALIASDTDGVKPDGTWYQPEEVTGGLVQLTAGTGGFGTFGFNTTPRSHSAKLISPIFGALFLRLRADGAWGFAFKDTANVIRDAGWYNAAQQWQGTAGQG